MGTYGVIREIPVPVAYANSECMDNPVYVRAITARTHMKYTEIKVIAEFKASTKQWV